jgi:hypothetical protein
MQVCRVQATALKNLIQVFGDNRRFGQSKAIVDQGRDTLCQRHRREARFTIAVVRQVDCLNGEVR